MNEFDIRNFAVDWYTMGRRFLPALRSPMFGRYVGQSLVFAHQTMGIESRKFGASSHVPVTIKIDKNIPTAALNLKTGEILLGANMFTATPYKERFGESALIATEEIAIAVINGLIVHEALHVRWTMPCGWDMMEAITAAPLGQDYLDRYGEDLCLAALNCIEDIYIESMLDAPVLKKWLDITHEVLITKEQLDAVIENENGYEPVVQGVQGAGAYKNPKLRNHDIFKSVLPKKAVKILEKAARGNARTLELRVAEALDFLECFDPPADPQNMQLPASCKVAGVAGQEDGSVTMPMSGDGDKSPEGDESSGESSMSDAEFGRLASVVSRAAKETQEDNSDRMRVLLPALRGQEAEWQKPLLLDVFDTPNRGYPHRPIPSETNYNFLRDLVALRSDNRAPGPARKTGSRMVIPRLTRIVTDGKIMAKTDGTDKRSKRMEVNILGDFSGSMSGVLLRMVLGVLEEMSDALCSANIAHGIYGHTTVGHSDQPYVFHIFSFDMIDNHNAWDRKKRLERASYVETVENYDGVAIDMVSGQYTGRDAWKYLFVLSDGLPAGPGYRGPVGVEHTKSVVADVRNRGIDVIAISLVEHVVHSNDKIYGRENNIDGSQNLSSEFRRVLTSIAGRKV